MPMPAGGAEKGVPSTYFFPFLPLGVYVPTSSTRHGMEGLARATEEKKIIALLCLVRTPN